MDGRQYLNQDDIKKIKMWIFYLVNSHGRGYPVGRLKRAYSEYHRGECMRNLNRGIQLMINICFASKGDDHITRLFTQRKEVRNRSLFENIGGLLENGASYSVTNGYVYSCGRFYVNMINENFEQFTSELNRYFSFQVNCVPCRSSPQELANNLTSVAVNILDSWFRGVVISDYEMKMEYSYHERKKTAINVPRVFLIDVGKTYSLQTRDLFILPDHFKIHKPFAYACRLAHTIPIRDYKYDNRGSQVFENMISRESSVEMHVVEKGIDNLYAVYLSTPRFTNINRKMGAKRWVKFNPSTWKRNSVDDIADQIEDIQIQEQIDYEEDEGLELDPDLFIKDDEYNNELLLN